MAVSRQPQNRANAGARPLPHQMYEPLPSRGRWKKILVAAAAAGLVAGVVAADKVWSWRDSLRRLARGEEIPAFRVNEWEDATSVREKLASRLLSSGIAPAVDDRDMRRNLALHTLITSAGEDSLSQGGRQLGALMEELCLDVDWLEEITYSCPLEYADKALPILAYIYRTEKKKMVGMPCNRRLAAALAFEFARAGKDEKEARSTFLFYAASGQKHWLNNHFAELSLWEMRVLASRFTDAAWSREETLTWFQRNRRLPAQGYTTLGNTLGTCAETLFGEPVDSEAVLFLYRNASEGGIASMYEASGCSTPLIRAQYAATAACANGVPALVAAGESGAACMVVVNGQWESSSPLEEGMTTTWKYLGSQHPDFVRLAASLSQQTEKSRESARLAQMGQFHYDAGNRPLSHSFFREALKLQPLNYAAWVSYHACGAPQNEIAEAAAHFETLPGVADALRSLAQ